MEAGRLRYIQIFFFRISRLIVCHYKKVELFFAAASIAMLLCIPAVKTNYDMTKYLPANSKSAQSIALMKQEFGYPGTAVLMLSDVTPYEARLIKQEIAGVPGVASATWIDSLGQVLIGDDFFYAQPLDGYYKDGSALISLQFTEGDASRVTFSALDRIFEITGDSGHMSGPAIDNYALGSALKKEIPPIAVMVVVVLFIILNITTDSWLEPVLFIFVTAIGVLLNMGSNILLGEISFLSASVAALIQLAVSMDYSIFMLHTFAREKDRTPSMERALSFTIIRSFSSITSSGMTTVVGCLALCAMSFSLGADIGLVLAKGILLSVLTVQLLMPALLLELDPWLKKTAHRRFLSADIMGKLSGFLFRAKGFVFAAVLILFVPVVFSQDMLPFSYGTAAIGASEGSRAWEDERLIRQTFGNNNTLIIMVPNESSIKEERLAAELKDLPYVKSVTSLAATIPAGIPAGFLPDMLISQLQTKDWARLVLNVNTDQESDEAFAALDEMRSLAAKYYTTAHFLSTTAAIYDIKSIILNDSKTVSLLSILGIILVVFITFLSPTGVLITILPIETGIFMNVFFAYLHGRTISYVGYLICQSLQLSTTIDYAILMVNNYIYTRRREENVHKAVSKTLSQSILSVMTSGTTLAVVGLALSRMCSIQAVADIGRLVGIGAILSMLMTLTVLPVLLGLFDRFFFRERGLVYRFLSRDYSEVFRTKKD